MAAAADFMGVVVTSLGAILVVVAMDGAAAAMGGVAVTGEVGTVVVSMAGAGTVVGMAVAGTGAVGMAADGTGTEVVHIGTVDFRIGGGDIPMLTGPMTTTTTTKVVGAGHEVRRAGL